MAGALVRTTAKHAISVGNDKQRNHRLGGASEDLRRRSIKLANQLDTIDFWLESIKL